MSRPAPPDHLLDRHPATWPEAFAALGGRPFQARSAARWLWRRGAADWDAMTDLPAALRARLAERWPLPPAREVGRRVAEDGAVKALLELRDGARVEAVRMPGTRGHTLCISTQVGCPIRCAFCASGMDGLERNLTPGEILAQALWALGEGGFGRLVVMGMGEMGHNLEATLAALDVLLDEDGLGLGARRVTVSTVGPRGALQTLAAWGRPVHVALSLHAPDDALRRELVPGVARRSIAETLDEADAAFRATGREYTVEYVLLAGVNDRPEQAQALAELLRERRCHVNLIPYNPVEGLPFARPPLADRRSFAATLREAGLSVTLRRSLGRSAEAACGQLRRRPPAAPV